MEREFSIIPLGVSSAIPMHGRHLSGFLVQTESMQIVVDCGEGTQFRLSKTGFKPGKLKAILISHLHGDHWYGLPGFLSSLSLGGRSKGLTLIAPSALETVLNDIPGVAAEELSYPITFIPTDQELSSVQLGSLTIRWLELDHAVFCTGFRFEESDGEGNLDVDAARALGISEFEDYRLLKEGQSVENKLGQVVNSEDVVAPGARGRVLAYVNDTRPCSNGVELAQNADLLVHESTFTIKLQERAQQTGHSTAAEAAEVASKSHAKRLLLTHFSARYDTVDAFVEEARSVFPDSECAVELEKYHIEQTTEPA